jgi:uncharacterized LabA/DUF88 family protein
MRSELVTLVDHRIEVEVCDEDDIAMKVKPARQDVGITIDVLDAAPRVDEVVLLSGDGDFDLLLEKVIRAHGWVWAVAGSAVVAAWLRTQLRPPREGEPGESTEKKKKSKESDAPPRGAAGKESDSKES